MGNFKILLLTNVITSTIILILVTNNPTSSSTTQQSINNTTAAPFNDSKLKNLQLCLVSNGVNEKDIIQLNSGNYTDLNWQGNTLNGYITPMAYLLASDVSNIKSAIKCCRELNIRPVARSGGHSFTKYSFGDSGSLIIDLAKLNQISVDPGAMTCVIGSGARVGLISSYLLKEDQFMIPTGICPTVGVTGLTLGGGYGYFTRYLGLASDNLIELEMIDAKGELLIINNSTNEDLFWALRGGGGGSFGIVTNFKFKMHSAPKYVAYGIYLFYFDDFPQFFYAWQSLITSDIPNSLGTLITMLGDKIQMEIFNVNLEKKKIVKFEELLKSFSFPIFTYNNVTTLSYSEFLFLTSKMYTTAPVTDLSELGSITKEISVGKSKAKSIYVDKILTKEDISKFHTLLSPFVKLSNLHMELNGGAINKFSSSDTAFVHRNKNLYHIKLNCYSSEDLDTNFEAIETSMKHVYEESKMIFNHRESYQNYLDPDIRDYLERYYGANLKKLIQVKTRIDPENIFYHPQSVPVNL